MGVNRDEAVKNEVTRKEHIWLEGERHVAEGNCVLGGLCMLVGRLFNTRRGENRRKASLVRVSIARDACVSMHA